MIGWLNVESALTTLSLLKTTVSDVVKGKPFVSQEHYLD